MVDLSFIYDDVFDYNHLSKCKGLKQLSQLVFVEFLKENNNLIDSGSGGIKLFSTNDKGQAEAIATRATSLTLRRITARQDSYKLLPTEKLLNLKFVSLTRENNKWKVSLEIESEANERETITV